MKFTADFPEDGSSGFSVEVRLMRGRPAIELAYTLRRTKSGHPSSFYVAFPFNGKKLAFDVPGGLVYPGENQLEGTSSAWNTALEIDWPDIRALQETCLRSGINKVGLPDLIIAQQAIRLGIPLFSLDRHFTLMSRHVNLVLWPGTQK